MGALRRKGPCRRGGQDVMSSAERQSEAATQLVFQNYDLAPQIKINRDSFGTFNKKKKLEKNSK